MVGFVHGEECRYRDFGFLKDVKMVRFSSIPPRVLPLLATAARGPPVPGGAGPLLPRWRALPAQVVLLILSPGSQASPRGEAEDSAFLSIRDTYLLEPNEWTH